MRILIAPDSFKGSMTARQAAEAIEAGIARTMPYAQIAKLPMADGGEGTVEVLVENLGGTIHRIMVQGPLGSRVEANYGILADGETGVMEMASASGLVLVPEALRNPMNSNTFGTGELLSALLDQGCRKIVIGIGGSATNDGGTGMAQALGIRFLDSQGAPIDPRGGNLDGIDRICMEGLDPRLADAEIWVACDVNNPLLGEQGAAYVYGPQKGATAEMVEILDKNLAHLNNVIVRCLGVDVSETPGAGAAGGLGAGLMVFAGGRFVSGVELIMDMVHFEKALQNSHCLVTGEGKLDLQTLRGKVVAGLVQKAEKHGIPTFIFAGEVSGDSDWENQNLVVPFSIAQGPAEQDTMMKDGVRLLTRASAQVFKTVHIAARRMKTDGQTKSVCNKTDS